MIQQVVHTEPGGDAAGVRLALAVAYALHAPAGRAPEVAPTALTTPSTPRAARRTGTAKRARRRTARG